MNIEERPTYFIQRPDDSAEDEYFIFRLIEEWYSLDGDKLLLPVDPLEMTGDDMNEHPPGLLSQYGSSELLLQMATSGELEEGSTWYLGYDDRRGFVIEPHE